MVANMVAWEASWDMVNALNAITIPAITDTVLESVPITNVFSLKKQLPTAQTAAVMSAEVMPIAIRFDAPAENKSAPWEMA